MALRNDQIVTLMGFVASVTADGLTCDGCLEHVPELAESQLGDMPINQVLEKVLKHLENCPCCAKEYETFLVALDAIGVSETV